MPLVITLPGGAWAIGHGPSFGLATPTLGQGAWELDQGLMQRAGTAGDRTMARGMLGYGLTPDVQVSVSVPALLAPAPLIAARGTSMMPTDQSLEGLLGWRFQRYEPGVGQRLESTVYVGGGAPILGAPAHMVGQVATGYASRSWYWWGGAGYESRFGSADHAGDTLFYSMVAGYRPPAWQVNPPLPDARLFVEALGEQTGASLVGGVPVPGTGTQQLLVGPTTLILWDRYGVSGGVLFPVYQQQSNPLPRERYRVVLNGTYFF